MTRWSDDSRIAGIKLRLKDGCETFKFRVFQTDVAMRACALAERPPISSSSKNHLPIATQYGMHTG